VAREQHERLLVSVITQLTDETFVTEVEDDTVH